MAGKEGKASGVDCNIIREIEREEDIVRTSLANYLHSERSVPCILLQSPAASLRAARESCFGDGGGGGPV